MAAIAPDNTPPHSGTQDTSTVIENSDVQSTTAPTPAQLGPAPNNEQPDISSQRSRSRSAVRILQSLSPTLTLENSGSVARDHLASERTWLAYVRTSLAIAGTGVALVQLFTISAMHEAGMPFKNNEQLGETIQKFTRPLGATTVLLGLGVLCVGVQRYFKIQKAMTQGRFPAARKTVVAITVVLAALVAAVFGVLVAIPRERD